MDFKSMAIASTLAGSVLLSGLTFTGAVNLQDIKNMGFGWADKVSTSVNETKDMLSKFNLFKADVTAQLNSKIAKINDLNNKIADLMSQVGSGQVSLEDANNEIARLNTELEKANNEVQALKDEYGLKDAQVEQAFADMSTDSDMDTTLTLDAETTTPSTDTSTTTTDTGSTTTTTNDYATEESSLQTAIMNNWGGLNSVTAEITDTTVTLTGSNVTANTPDQYISFINNATGKTATYSSQTATSYTYTIQ